MSGRGVLAADLGGTRMRVAVFDDAGSLRERREDPTPRDDPSALAHLIRRSAAESALAVEAAVIGVPGVVSYAEGHSLGLTNLPGWAPHLTETGLSGATGLPVRLANDADLAALGEHRFGAGRGVEDMVFVTVSTGVGAGVVIGGRLLRGRLSLAEAGQTIIDRREGATLEQLASGRALERLAGGEAGAAVVARARAGDARALATLREVAEALALGVFNLAHLFMPQRVVIGGGVAHAGELLIAPSRELLARCGCAASRAQVVQAEQIEDAGLLGAFAYWQELSAG